MGCLQVLKIWSIFFPLWLYKILCCNELHFKENVLEYISVYIHEWPLNWYIMTWQKKENTSTLNRKYICSALHYHWTGNWQMLSMHRRPVKYNIGAVFVMNTITHLLKHLCCFAYCTIIIIWYQLQNFGRKLIHEHFLESCYHMWKGNNNCERKIIPWITYFLVINGWQ